MTDGRDDDRDGYEALLPLAKGSSRPQADEGLRWINPSTLLGINPIALQALPLEKGKKLHALKRNSKLALPLTPSTMLGTSKGKKLLISLYLYATRLVLNKVPKTL